LRASDTSEVIFFRLPGAGGETCWGAEGEGFVGKPENSGTGGKNLDCGGWRWEWRKAR